MEVSDYIIVGAGISGLTVASILSENGKSVLVVDKGRQVGGRMASRRIGDIRFDHGAQHFRAKSKEFMEFVSYAKESSVVKDWEALNKEFQLKPPCYIGRDGMTSLPKLMASKLNVLLSEKVTKINCSNSTVKVKTESEKVFQSQGIILTAPLFQSLALIPNDLFKDNDLKSELLDYGYYKTIAVLLAFEKELSFFDKIGGIKDPTNTISWIASNTQKGISKKTALTIHFNYDFSESNFEENEKKLIELAIFELKDILKELPKSISSFIYSKVHRWRYSSPKKIFEEPFLKTNEGPSVYLAGDIFGGSRVEGGFISGLKLGEHIIKYS